MNVRDEILGYYLYVLIVVFLAAFIFRPYFNRHKNLRRTIIILNLFNIIFYIVIALISKQEKLEHIYIIKAIWNGINGTSKKAN